MVGNITELDCSHLTYFLVFPPLLFLITFLSFLQAPKFNIRTASALVACCAVDSSSARASPFTVPYFSTPAPTIGFCRRLLQAGMFRWEGSCGLTATELGERSQAHKIPCSPYGLTPRLICTLPSNIPFTQQSQMTYLGFNDDIRAPLVFPIVMAMNRGAERIGKRIGRSAH